VLACIVQRCIKLCLELRRQVLLTIVVVDGRRAITLYMYTVWLFHALNLGCRMAVGL
jgi:hypothetical protein